MDPRHWPLDRGDGVLEGTFVFINEKAKNPKIPPSVQGELVAKSAGVSVDTFLSDPFGGRDKMADNKTETKLLDDVRSPEVRLPAEPLIKWQGRSGGAIKNPNGNVVPVSEVTLSNQETEEDTGTQLNSVFFATPQLGWVVGVPGTILHTEDGGINTGSCRHTSRIIWPRLDASLLRRANCAPSKMQGSGSVLTMPMIANR